MARIIATALSAVTIIGLGIVALQYRAEDLGDAGLTNQSAEAYNLSTNVSGDVMTVTANAIPWLFAAVLIVLLIVVLLINR